MSIVSGELAGLNLTRILDREDFREKQYLDSVCPYRDILEFSKLIEVSESVVDVGFGGGFPILPLANELNQKIFIGVESKRKKVEAVDFIAKKLGIVNCKFYHGRIEEFWISKNMLVVSKAVGSIAKVLGFLNCDKGTRVVFYKGPNFYEAEKKDLELIKENWNVVFEKNFSLPSGDNRVILIVESKSVLRRTKSKKLKFLDS
ncbi:MAG: class I SAM-dependent methyltransferase [Halobacteriovoraceae bacterium]|nr:class I SAM-dependent methyltransferase [Halobacteriovoraceae bacterium]